MGTTKGKPTPSGGEWTPLKNDITDNLSGDNRATPDRIVGGTVRALGGLGFPTPATRSTGSGGGGGGGGRSGGRASLGGVTSRLGGFGGAFQHGGLDEALDRKSTRLNSSHLVISYAVFCLKKKKLN